MRKSKSRTKKVPKRVLALPDLEHAKTAVLNSLSSASGQRTYEHAIREFVAWYCSEPRLAFNRTRLGNWLTPEQGRRLVEATTSSRKLRDQAMVAMLIGCGLRRGELLALQLESIQQREEHWVIVDLVGKGGHVRTVPIPTWVKHHIDASTAAAAITHCPVFRAINKGRSRLGRRHVAEGAVGCRARRCGSRRHRQAGAARPETHVRPSLSSRRQELDQIQFLLGHVSIQTTERYLGCKQKIRIAVNDRLGIEPDAA